MRLLYPTLLGSTTNDSISWEYLPPTSIVTSVVYKYIQYPTGLSRISTVRRLPRSPSFILQAGYTARKSGFLTMLSPCMGYFTQLITAAPHLLYSLYS